MPLSNDRKQTIENIIIDSLKRKFEVYNPETKYMPFHYRLLGQDRMALYSFIQSLNTTFGTSIFEPVAETMAKMAFDSAQKQYVVGDVISVQAQKEIQCIMNELTINKVPNKTEEVERIRRVCNIGRMTQLNSVKVDLLLKDSDGTVHLFDLKTVKPNISNFKDFKRTLLEWTAIYLANEPHANVMSYIGIPYNPYFPEPYQRWTVRGMLDIDFELKVDAELWNFFGGSDVYDDLLDCFERAGNQLRPVIDEYFSNRFTHFGST